MDEWIRRIGQAKAYIDNGMCRVGPRLDKESKDAALLSGHASRAVSLADAVVQLCRHGHAVEALPILRQLAETAVSMRWAACSAERAARVLEETAEGGWDGLWPSGRLAERMKEAGAEDEALSAAEDSCVLFKRANRSTAPWSHVFPENQSKGAEAEEVLRWTVRVMGHVLKALDTKWPGSFPGSEALWG